MPSIRQPSFAAGEIAPGLYGRSDVAKYAAGAKKLRNFFVGQTGKAISRPGSKYIATTKTAGKKVRLIPFIYSSTSTETNFILEFGHNYIRFFKQGAAVMDGGLPYGKITTYTEAELPYIRTAQTGDILTICHPAHAPAELRFFTDTNWTLGTISFDRPAPSFGGGNPFLHWPDIYDVAVAGSPVKEWVYQATTLNRSDSGVVSESGPYTIVEYGLYAIDPWQNDWNYGLGERVGGFHSLIANNLSHDPTGAGAADWTVDLTVTPTPIYRSTIVAGAKFRCSADYPIHIQFPQTVGSISLDPTIIGFRLYKGRGGLMGWIGDINNGKSFTDDGIEPDYTRAPPQGRNPFKIYNSSNVLVRTEAPACVTYFEERRVFARSNERPGYVWGSATGDYSNFDQPLIEVASGAWEFDLASRRREEVRWLLGHQKLVIGSNGGIWSAGGAGGGPLTFDNPDFKVQTEAGASWLEPLVIDDSAVYGKAKGTGARELTYEITKGKFSVADLSVVSQHFFQGHQLVSWTYAEDPWGLVYAVRDDGAMLVCTLIRDQEMLAWSEWTTDGEYESVACVPEGTEDGVYVVVARSVNGSTVRYVERLSSRVFDEDTDATTEVNCLDCAKAYTRAAATAVTGLSHLEAKEVYALADGAVQGPFTVTGGAIDLNVAAAEVTVGLRYRCLLQKLPPAVQGSELRTKTKGVSHLAVEFEASRGFKVGPSEDKLYEWQQRQVSDNFDALALQTGIVRQAVGSGFDLDACVCVVQDDPLPLTVLAVTMELQVGDD